MLTVQILILPYSGLILAPLYNTLLLKLKVMRKFPKLICRILTFLGRINLHSLEIIGSMQVINYFISFIISLTLSNILLFSAIKV